MTSEEELQSEELEVLKSIYEGDERFSIRSDSEFQYKYGEDKSAKSFILEISWPKSYPMEGPGVSMGTFYNAHILDSVKTNLLESIEKEVEQYIGMSMTFSLFEFVKENYDSLVSNQPEELPREGVESLNLNENMTAESPEKVSVRKEQLTKSQKRRMWNRGGLDVSDRPRGWNWVDIVKHLSSTGSKDDATA